jgi:hypothetical protein
VSSIYHLTNLNVSGNKKLTITFKTKEQEQELLSHGKFIRDKDTIVKYYQVNQPINRIDP